MPPPDLVTPARLIDVVRYCLRHPEDALIRRWNYKAAITSAGVRSVIFLVANASAGAEAATTAAATELAYRLVTAGFYGALTQHLGRVTPPRVGWLAAMVCLPLLGHSGELLVHWWRGTPNLGASLFASVGLTLALHVVQPLRDAPGRARRRRARTTEPVGRSARASGVGRGVRRGRRNRGPAGAGRRGHARRNGSTPDRSSSAVAIIQLIAFSGRHDSRTKPRLATCRTSHSSRSA